MPAEDGRHAKMIQCRQSKQMFNGYSDGRQSRVNALKEVVNMILLLESPIFNWHQTFLSFLILNLERPLYTRLYKS